jgi:sugar/nucleoside kinase (ribokinase family)
VPARVVTVGEVMLDVLGPAASRGRTHGRVEVRPGGTAVTAALAARSAGAEALVIGRVGDDLAASAIRLALEAAGVEARLAVDPALPTGTYVELGDTIVASRGANAALAAQDVAEIEADAVLVSGYLLAHEDTVHAARTALAADVRWRAVTATPLVSHGFRNANVLFANAEEAERLAADDFEIVCVTRAAEGATVFRNGRAEQLPPTGVTGTGAGDAFAGAFLASL